MPTFVLLTAFVVLSVGFAVVAANPRRTTNRAFGAASLIIAVWLACVYKAVVLNLEMHAGAAVDPTRWHRANAAVAAFFPWALWQIKQSIVSTGKMSGNRMHSLFWFCVGSVLVYLCYADSFIVTLPSVQQHQRGVPYIFYFIGMIAASIVLSVETYKAMRQQTGIRRVELQFLVLNLGLAGIIAATFNALGVFLPAPDLGRLSPLIALASFCSTAWALTVYRIFDARQITVAYAQRIALILLIGLGAWATHTGFGPFVSPPADFLVNVALWGAVGLWLDRKSRLWLDLGGEKQISLMRRDAIELSQSEADPEKLASRFEHFLRDACRTQNTALLIDRGAIFANQTLEIEKGLVERCTLNELEWATPESLDRRRQEPGLKELKDYLNAQSLALLLVAPRGSSVPSLILAFGGKIDESPFTYPEIERLQNIAELMDNILTHSRLTNQAALQAKMEHLAMMSRGLAHDLKNLITPVSSFLVHTDGRYAPDSAEAEVHDAAKRSVRIMTDYVREALFFSERLAPKFEPVDLVQTFEAVREVWRIRAERRGVTLATTSSFDTAFTADRVLLQRMLANLVGNAIDASNAGQTVTLAASHGRPGWLRIEIRDTGCGVAPEHLNRIFEPYFTTKEFGDEVRGFGLGLTICQKIVDLHGGTVAVASEVGHGTSVTVDLPLAQHASPASPMAGASPN